jgi:hypothetical protein
VLNRLTASSETDLVQSAAEQGRLVVKIRRTACRASIALFGRTSLKLDTRGYKDLLSSDFSRPKASLDTG